MKIISIASARPNFVKLAAVHHALKDKPGVEHIIIHTGQHYDPMLSDVFFEQLNIAQPKYNLGIHGGTREEVIESTKNATIPVLQDEQPDWVLVYGDVNGALGGAQAAKEVGCRLGHVEAGLRSFDMDMPEEHNRIGIDQLADLLLCTEQSGIDNLLKEGAQGRVELVGNTMIATLMTMMPTLQKETVPVVIDGAFAVITLHRPSNVDAREPLEQNLHFLREVSERIPCILPTHHRLQSSLAQFNLSLPANVMNIGPMPYIGFLRLLQSAAFVITDSGGIQEEAVLLKKRCFTLRKNTERPSTIESGSNVLIDINKQEDRQTVLEYAANPVHVDIIIPPLWDGSAGENIARILLSA